jgi:hypothetical protein
VARAGVARTALTREQLCDVVLRPMAQLLRMMGVRAKPVSVSTERGVLLLKPLRLAWALIALSRCVACGRAPRVVGRVETAPDACRQGPCAHRVDSRTAGAGALLTGTTSLR